VQTGIHFYGLKDEEGEKECFTQRAQSAQRKRRKRNILKFNEKDNKYNRKD
jgi:hypothetical protein